MAVFEFRRHSLKNSNHPATISSEGLQFASRVGRELMTGKKFDFYCVSSYERTRETLAAFADGARWNDVEQRMTIPPIYLDWPALQELWRVCHRAEKAGEDMMAAALSHDEAFVRNAAASIAHLFKSYVLLLKDDARVLVIGHSPHMELLVLGLTTDVTPGLPPIVLPGMKECQGFRIHTRVIDGEVASLIEHIGTDLDPSDIRNEMFGA